MNDESPEVGDYVEVVYGVHKGYIGKILSAERFFLDPMLSYEIAEYYRGDKIYAPEDYVEKICSEDALFMVARKFNSTTAIKETEGTILESYVGILEGKYKFRVGVVTEICQCPEDYSFNLTVELLPDRKIEIEVESSSVEEIKDLGLLI